MKNGTLIGVLVGLMAIGVIYFSMDISYDTKEITIREAAVAKQDLNKASFDNMWKIITGTGQVAKQYKKDFQEVYKDIMDARYQNNATTSNGNAPSVENNAMLFNFMKEHNPDFSPDLHKKVANAIQAERTKFYHNQELLMALKQEHSTLIKTFPGRWFLSDRKELDITIITSTKTEEVFTTGKEDDVEIF